MGFSITQFGGGSGSHAGDCCLLTYGEKMDKHILIDLGNLDTFTTMKANLNGELVDVIFTHLHEDHIGAKKQWMTVCEKAKGIVFLPPNPYNQEKLIEIFNYRRQQEIGQLIHFPKNNEVIFTYTEPEIDLNVSIKAIIPDLDESITLSDENETSMGCLITVCVGSQCWRMLTLGDMKPLPDGKRGSKKSLDYQISSVVNGSKINVIKLPHHGSGDNVIPEVIKIVQQWEPKLVISGWTLTSLNEYMDAIYNSLNTREPTDTTFFKEIIFLFNLQIFPSIQSHFYAEDPYAKVPWTFKPELTDRLLQTAKSRDKLKIFDKMTWNFSSSDKFDELTLEVDQLNGFNFISEPPPTTLSKYGREVKKWRS